MIRESAAEYRNLSYGIRYPRSVCASHPDGLHCPMCDGTTGQVPRCIQLDAAFSLKHWKSSGHGPVEGFHEGRLFIETPDEARVEQSASSITAHESNVRYAVKMTTIINSIIILFPFVMYIIYI